MKRFSSIKQQFVALCGLLFTVFTLLVINSILVMPVMIPAATVIKRIILRII